MQEGTFRGDCVLRQKQECLHEWLRFYDSCSAIFSCSFSILPTFGQTYWHTQLPSLPLPGTVMVAHQAVHERQQGSRKRPHKHPPACILSLGLRENVTFNLGLLPSVRACTRLSFRSRTCFLPQDRLQHSLMPVQLLRLSPLQTGSQAQQPDKHMQ